MRYCSLKRDISTLVKGDLTTLRLHCRLLHRNLHTNKVKYHPAKLLKYHHAL